MGRVGDYLGEVRRRSAAAVDVVGAYVGGSYALGAYEHGRSDLDVAVVVRGPLAPSEKATLVARLRHEALPCPSRGLELVVYTAAAAGSREVTPDFELNLDTGAGVAFRVDLEPDPTEGHWYAIDRAILREHGVPLLGPPPAAVFGRLPRPALLGVVANSLHWHVAGPARMDDAVLNACRGLRFALEDVWSAKPDAGRWALRRVEDAATVAAALAARSGGAPPAPAAARAFVAAAIAAIAATPAAPAAAARPAVSGPVA
jgi:hypothetical protein